MKLTHTEKLSPGAKNICAARDGLTASKRSKITNLYKANRKFKFKF